MAKFVNQYQLAESFGKSFKEMDKILIEHGLKSGELANQKAINDGYAIIPSAMGLSYLWNAIKISELTGMQFKDEIVYHVDDVLERIDQAYVMFDGDFELLAEAVAYMDVPKELQNEVEEQVNRKIIGDRRQACEKCSRMTLFGVHGSCWRCLPDDSFRQKRLDIEKAAREAAAQLASDGWGTFYDDHKIVPKNTDMELWNGAVDYAIDKFLTTPTDPSTFGTGFLKGITNGCTHITETNVFRFAGFENNDWKRCCSFLILAHKIVTDVLSKGGR